MTLSHSRSVKVMFKDQKLGINLARRVSKWVTKNWNSIIERYTVVSEAFPNIFKE